MSKDSGRRGPLKAPQTLASTNSSAGSSDASFNSPGTAGSIILNEGNNQFMAQTLRSYIDALKFDPSAQHPENSTVRKDSSLLVQELLGQDKKGPNKRTAQSGTTKSKAAFSASKSPSAYLGQNLVDSLSSRSQQQSGSKETGKREKTKSSTNTVIREWGKRPLLVESEAPWTPRNRMYQNALKAVARAKEMSANGGLLGHNNNGLPILQSPQPLSLGRGITIPPAVAMRYAANNEPIPVILPSPGGVFPYGQVSPVGRHPPILTGISPMPVGVDANNRPVAVSLGPQGRPYQFSPSGVMFPVQQQQSQNVVYGHVNSQGMWMPIMEQQRKQ